MGYVRGAVYHVAGAAAAFVALSYMLYAANVGPALAQFFMRGWLGPLLWVLGFSAIGMVAQSMARAHRSRSVQYGGLALNVLLYGIVMSPLIWFAGQRMPQLLAPAAGLTILTFAGLSGFVLATKKDFSFLGPVLAVAGLVLLGVIVLSIFFPAIGSGIWLVAALLIFTAGLIVYQTSNVLHQFRTDEHVGASLQLFASLAMLFYYILILLMHLNRRD
jgi:FtsH-binding integral membrane protein